MSEPAPEVAQLKGATQAAAAAAFDRARHEAEAEAAYQAYHLLARW